MAIELPVIPSAEGEESYSSTFVHDLDSPRVKGHFFSDHSALTNRPDAKTQLSLIFFRISSYFFLFIFCLKITQ